MNHTLTPSLFRRCARVLLAVLPLLSVPLLADTASTGTVIGRIQNADTGNYLYGVQVQAYAGATVAPQAAPVAMTSTDQSGTYHFVGLPAGSVTIKTIYSGMKDADQVAVVQPGNEAMADFQLHPIEVVTLDAFQVNVEKQMSATELAINSQRYASNLKSVVSVDDLGFIGDGGIANALKFLPGVDLEQDGYGYGNAVTLSGAPSANVPVTFGGFQMTTSADSTQGISAPGLGSVGTPQRSTQLMQMSLNNISRIEINHSTLPDDPGSALAGSINFVPKSAFEYDKAKYVVSAFGAADANKLRAGSMNGPFSKNISTKFPGAVISAIVPVNKRFGFSATLSTNTVPKAYVDQSVSWNADYLASSGTYVNTPLDPSHYLSNGMNLNSVLSTYQRSSVNLTADYKISAHGTLSATYTQAYNTLDYGDRNIAWGNTGWASPTLSTLTNEVEINNTSLQPRVLNQTITWAVVDANRQETLKYTDTLAGWKIEMGESYGNSRKQNRDADIGNVFSILYNIRPLSVLNFNNIGPWGPASINAVAPNGTPVDPSSLASFVASGNFTTTYYNPTTGAITTVNSTLPALRFKPLWVSDHRFEGYGSATHDLTIPHFPTTVKLGFDVTEYSRVANMDPKLGGNGSGFIYLGNLPGTSFIQNNYNTPLIAGYGTPQFLDPVALGHYFLANPSLFVESRPWNDYSSATTVDYYLEEVIPAAYVRFDSSTLNNRLRFSYGVRYEQTRDNGLGPYYNPGGNYAHNSAGQVLATNGQVYVPGTGQTIQTLYPTNSLAWAQALYYADGSQARSTYNNFFPSAAVSYDVTHDIVARISYSRTIGRPDLGNIYPSLNLPDPTVVSATTVTTIKVNNTSLHPWQSNNVGASLEYYSPDGLSNLTIRGYRRFVWNAFSTQTLSASQTANYLTKYGIDPAEYPGSVIQTPVNMEGTIVTSGLEVSGSYTFDKILPDWLQGIRFAYSGTRATQTGGGVMAVQFAAQNLYVVPWTVGAGLGITRKRFSISLNSKFNSKTRLQYEDYTSNSAYEPNEFLYKEAAIRTDLDASYHVTPNISVFMNARDIFGYTLTEQIYSPNTPDIAKNFYRAIYQPVWTAGVKAEF